MEDQKKRMVHVLLILGIVMILLEVIKVAILADLASNNFELDSLQRQVKQLDTQNLVLQEQVLSLTSLTIIGQKAKAEGFVPAKVLYIQ